MPNRSSCNVLPFGGPDSIQVRRPKVESERLVEVCRDRLAHGLATAFARNLGSANDDLLALADRATSLEQQQLHFAAMDFLSNRGQQLLQQFRATFVTEFDASVQALRHGRRREAAAPEGFGELSLVATDDFERDLAIGKLSARAACNCAQPLTVLDRQLASLLQLPRISQDENPLYPRAVFTSLLRALGDMAVGQHLALLLLHEIERQTSVELAGIYSELAQHLANSGVLPDLPIGKTGPVQRSAPIDEGAAAPDLGASHAPLAFESTWGPTVAPVSGAPADPSRFASGYGDLAAGNEDVFTQLTRAIQAAAAAHLAPQSMYASQPPMPLRASPEPSVGPGVTQLVEALTGLQRGRADIGNLPGLGAVQIDPDRGNVIQQIRSTPLASWSHPVDVLTIDIVSMLFDAIFNDPDLPATLRAEIAKLQIPVLKVALMDKAFFSNKKHPARRLLDAIASSGLGRNDADEPRLMAKIGSIVDEVVAGFETDIDIFSAQVKKLEEFLEDEEARAESRTTRVVDKLVQQDRQELASVRAGTEIESRIRDRTVPILVADFLSRHWRQVLAPAFVRGGEEGAPWIEALATMDDLVWSVAPKHSPEERSRLLATLPELLKRLRMGLESVDLKEAWDPFFTQLIRLHVGALNKEVPPDKQPQPTTINPSAMQPPPPAPVPADALPGLKTLELVEMPSQIEYRPEAPPRSPQMPSGVLADRHLHLAQSLGVGAWVEFESLRGTRKTLRLSWVSDFRGVFLFTNRQGENALTLAATSLADHLREGRARVLSQDRLTDRAVAQLLEKSGAELTSRPS